MFSKRHEGLHDRGAAAVEMALVLPMLLLVLFGLVDFGRAFNAQMQVTQAAREAVRVKSLGGTDGDAKDRAVAAVGGMDPAGITATFTQCTTAGGPLANAEATVRYSFAFITPLGPIAGLFGASTLPGVGTVKVLSSTGVMRCAG
jgi:Flp pilus assembly protein TadG